MRIWRIAGRYFEDPPPADWRQRLASRLGERPRRVGAWVELALYGALKCLDSAGETRLPDDALLSVSTLHGPDIALRAALAEAQSGLPLPIGFLTSQPGQVLPALARYLDWHGEGRCLSCRAPALALQLACVEAGPAGLLAGWVGRGRTGPQPVAAPAARARPGADSGQRRFRRAGRSGRDPSGLVECAAAPGSFNSGDRS